MKRIRIEKCVGDDDDQERGSGDDFKDEHSFDDEEWW